MARHDGPDGGPAAAARQRWCGGLGGPAGRSGAGVRGAAGGGGGGGRQVVGE